MTVQTGTEEKTIGVHVIFLMLWVSASSQGTVDSALGALYLPQVKEQPQDTSEVYPHPISSSLLLWGTAHVLSTAQVTKRV